MTIPLLVLPHWMKDEKKIETIKYPVSQQRKMKNKKDKDTILILTVNQTYRIKKRGKE